MPVNSGSYVAVMEPRHVVPAPVAVHVWNGSGGGLNVPTAGGAATAAVGANTTAAAVSKIRTKTVRALVTVHPMAKPQPAAALLPVSPFVSRLLRAQRRVKDS